MSENIESPKLPIPLPNEVFLSIDGGKETELTVHVHDLKEKNEFLFRTKTLVIRGVDLLVEGQGQEISYNKKTIILGDATQSDDFKLSVRGGSLSIDGIRASNIELVTIEANQKFTTIVKSKQEKKKKRRGVFRERLKSVGWSLTFFGLLMFMAYLTWLPFAKAEQAVQLYDKLLKVTADVDIPTEMPAVQVSKLSSNTNAPSALAKVEESLNTEKSKPVKVEAGATTVTIETEKNESGKKVDGAPFRRSSGTGGIAGLYFGMSCLLYLLFYLFVAFSAVAVFKGMRRHNKMTRNLQSVIDALENEHDKSARKAMQKKILDDMINTYLERPSAED